MSIPSGPDVEWVRTLRVGDVVAIAREGHIERRQTVRLIQAGTILLNAPFGTPGMLYDSYGWEYGLSPLTRPRYLVEPEDSKP